MFDPSSAKKKSESASSSSLPPELISPISEFHEAIQKLDSEVVNPLTSGFPSHSEAFVNLSAADRCKVDVASAFAISSLTWIWLKTLGQDPKETEVKGEIDRVKTCMKRLKEVELKNAKRARLDKGAAKRFVKSGLWNPRRSKDSEEKAEEETGAKKPRNQ